jgi:bifunctional enzyme CysN/CysC
LFDGGRQVYLLDGKNLQIGLDADVPEEDKQEMVRRFGEVALILLQSGQIVISTTNTFALADHQIIRTLVHPFPVISIHMSFEKVEAPEHTDLSFLASNDLKQSATAIERMMEQSQILL